MFEMESFYFKGVDFSQYTLPRDVKDVKVNKCVEETFEMKSLYLKGVDFL